MNQEHIPHQSDKTHVSNNTQNILSRKKNIGKTLSLCIACSLIGILGFCAFFSYSLASTSSQTLSTIFPDYNLFSMLGTYFGYSHTSLKGESGGRTNFLMVGKDYENKTDTIIILSYTYATKQFSAISLPRDLTIQDGYELHKINAVYSSALSRSASRTTTDNPEQFFTDVISNISGVPIHYTTFINIDGLSTLIDSVDGIDVDIQNSFTDCEYPTPHYIPVYYPELKQSLPYIRPCPEFNAGREHMNSTRALIYARSRKSFDNPSEAIDFARNTRQQLVIEALLTKITDQVKNGSLLLQSHKLQEFSQVVKDSIYTTMNGDEFSAFAKYLTDSDTVSINRYSLDFSSGIICPNKNGSTFIMLCDGTALTRSNPSKSQQLLQRIIRHLDNTALVNEFLSQTISIIGNNSAVITQALNSFMSVGFPRNAIKTNYSFKNIPRATRTSTEKALIYAKYDKYASLLQDPALELDTLNAEIITRIPDELQPSQTENTDIIVYIVDSSFDSTPFR